jgi:hypothetical protein
VPTPADAFLFPLYCEIERPPGSQGRSSRP